jgi:hypothetical protein
MKGTADVTLPPLRRCRVVSLGSRKTLCINDAVSRLGSDTRIADRCLDMQKGKKIMPTAPKHTTTDYWKEREKEVRAAGRGQAEGVEGQGQGRESDRDTKLEGH